MDFWHKMLRTISEPFQSRELSDDALLLQMEQAIQDAQRIRSRTDAFIDPFTIRKFEEKWGPACQAARKKSQRSGFLLSPSGRKVRSAAPEFLQCCEQLPAQAREHNDRLSQLRAASAGRLILPVEGRQLDPQQMCCITKEVMNHLVLAGAGTGKTTTIVGYVKYLVRQGLCAPEDLLVLSFTNASAAEMNQRLRAELGFPVQAMTFHKLGLEIITAVQGKKPRIFSADIRQFVRQQLDVLCQDRSYLRRLFSHLVYDRNDEKSEFDFSSEPEYKDHLRRNPPITLHNEVVKSYGELDIANFLTENGIRYIYEAEYPVDTRTEEYGQYHPDFYLPDEQLYIEYFGIDRKGQVPAYFSGRGTRSASEAYQDGIQWKRQLHKKHGTRMIEVYAYEKMEEQLLPCLEARLREAGVKLSPLPAEELWAGLSGTSNQKLDRIAELFGTVITLVKSNNCSLDDVRERNRSLNDLSSIDRVLNLIEPVFQGYQDRLAQRGEVDFSDMINLAAHYVQSGLYRHHWRYVVVDEYQDISQARYHLLHALRCQKNYRLFCVGDDWQSIYRFSGSDIGFILNFEKYWGPAEISRIETTYRFPESLIRVSSSFIMKNPDQKKKQLHSTLPDPGRTVAKLSAYSYGQSVTMLAGRLQTLPRGSSVLFLGRYRFDIRNLDHHPSFTYHYNNVTGHIDVCCPLRPDLKIQFMTIHSSKGLQADYVFILNNKASGMGFPSQITDAPILQLLLDNCDHYPFAEERRLFYVALTRAKKKVWLVTLRGNESDFVEEVDQLCSPRPQNAQKKEAPVRRCPRCGGRLILRRGSYGAFYGCENYAKTGCQYKENVYHKRKSSG